MCLVGSGVLELRGPMAAQQGGVTECLLPRLPAPPGLSRILLFLPSLGVEPKNPSLAFLRLRSEGEKMQCYWKAVS